MLYFLGCDLTNVFGCAQRAGLYGQGREALEYKVFALTGNDPSHKLKRTSLSGAPERVLSVTTTSRQPNSPLPHGLPANLARLRPANREYRELASQLVALPRGIFSGRLVFTVHLSFFAYLQKSAAAARVPLWGVHKGEYTFTKLPLHSKARGHGRRLAGEKLR